MRASECVFVCDVRVLSVITGYHLKHISVTVSSLFDILIRDFLNEFQAIVSKTKQVCQGERAVGSEATGSLQRVEIVRGKLSQTAAIAQGFVTACISEIVLQALVLTLKGRGMLLRMLDLFRFESSPQRVQSHKSETK